MPFDLNKIKNIAKDVSKEVVNVVGDKYLEIKANTNFDDGKYDEVIQAANEILKFDKFNYEMVLLKGKALMKQNKYDEAIEAFIEALAIDNKKIEPLLQIAAINSLQGNFDDAVDVYNSVLKKDNNNNSALLGLARNYFAKKEYECTNTYFNKIQTIDTKLLTDEDYYNWGLSLKEMGEFEKAKTKFEQANTSNPSDKYQKAIDGLKKYEFEIEKKKAHEYFNNNDFDNAIKCFNKTINSSSEILTDEDYYIWGLCIEEKGRDIYAHYKFKKAYDINPCDKYKNKMNSIEQKQRDASDELIKKAHKSFDNGMYKESDKYFSKASKFKWNNMSHEDYYTWGSCLMNLQRPTPAKDKFKKANDLKSCSKYSTAYKDGLNMSKIETYIRDANRYYNEKKYVNALKYVDKALELDSNNVKALLLRGDILSKQHDPNSRIYYEKVLKLDSNNKKAQIAINELEQVEDMSNPEKPAFWVASAHIETQKGNYLKAIDLINKAIEINPNNDFTWSKLCVAYQNIQDYPKALDAINRAIEISSENAQSWFNKGQTLFWLGDFRKSIRCFDKAIKLDPDECDDALAIKGMALIRLNRMSEAKDSLRKSLVNNPKNEFALETIKHIPDFLEIEANLIDYVGGAVGNVNPLWFGKAKYALDLVNKLKEKGVDISFELDSEMYSLLIHDSKKYLFNPAEIDGAVVYVTALWERKFK
ncbi:tetratricopeptide repeat protein [uncultured Methanobrevibacter sp.]|uniref:tetratricopeptide repeat protein n=1 Tax=uncultured Methanobrevibacter sp. TaxID=253161 RepID=UPI0025DB0F62|nr:tetratricopeptide repeat protein [uncultured Methanobrevibacter sp.]